MTLDDRQAWRDQLDIDGLAAVKTLIKLLEDMELRIQSLEEKVWGDE